MEVLLMIFLALVGLVLLLVFLSRREAEYFRSRGVLYLWNGFYRMVLGAIKGGSMYDTTLEMYEIIKKNDEKIAGTIDFGFKTTVVQDPDLIKHVLVKDFDHFVDRRMFQVAKEDRLFGKMLFSQKGDQWKDLRSKLSPTFTTGKIKRMFQIMKKSGNSFVTFLEEEVARSDGGEVELSDAYSKMTMDVIASVACGIDSKAFDSREPSLFEKMGNKLRFQFGGLELLKIFIIAMLPKLGDFLGLSLFAGEVQDFFTGAVASSIKQRQEKGEKRDDFIQLMLEVQSNQLKTDEGELGQFEKDAIIKSTGKEGFELDDEAIVANCVLFIVGGFDMTQSLLLYAAYALALNPEVQDKLRIEVDKIFEESDGDLTYDDVNKMEYLDMVINETLRYYPPAVMIDRGCVKDYKLPGTDFIIRKGEGIVIPILGLHHDEKYWPEPKKFIPERFSPENKGKINQYTFMPFGQGPRNCIGMRFALTEVKVAIVNLVRHFEVEPSKKTLIPMKYANANSLKPKGDMWLALHKRTV